MEDELYKLYSGKIFYFFKKEEGERLLRRTKCTNNTVVQHLLIYFVKVKFLSRKKRERGLLWRTKCMKSTMV